MITASMETAIRVLHPLGYFGANRVSAKKIFDIFYASSIKAALNSGTVSD